ncbi:MAG: hypothetical protein EOP84_04870 [Verrucomicrobiaceae bacterium]|nr:MAG: hypothetical protein EOP84_04870 [Verrucomicrobiaceae bacterium]
MNSFKHCAICLMASLQVAAADYELPGDICEGIAQSQIGENGGFELRGVDGERFESFVRTNWRQIIDHIDTLPPAEAPKGYAFDSLESARAASVANFAASCEILPPEEYLDCMESFLSLYENGRVSKSPLLRQLMGVEQKANFFEVNWEHPRVQAILQRVKELEAEPAVLGFAEAAAKGELADNYMTNRPDGDPGPQTLPGIRLKRPWGSLIEKYQALTGKKAPYDPGYDPRPDKRTTVGNPGGKVEPPSTRTERTRFPLWPWFAFAGGMVVAAVLLFFKRRGEAM